MLRKKNPVTHAAAYKGCFLLGIKLNPYKTCSFSEQLVCSWVTGVGTHISPINVICPHVLTNSYCD